MNLEKIKTQLEENKSFLSWRDSIGLSFEDFSIYKPLNEFNWQKIKQGKEDIGYYFIELKEDDSIKGVFYDMDNEAVRLNTLRKIGK